MAKQLAKTTRENKRVVREGIARPELTSPLLSRRYDSAILRARSPMADLVRTLLFVVAATCPVIAAPPASLASAIQHLRDQKSYSWELINADPGPVAQQFETRRGTVTTVQQSTLPNIKGKVDRNGDMLIERQWLDGLKLDTIITADGTMVTRTPEGWLTDREILTAQAEERLRDQTPTPRYLWLRRADRPDIRRPDQELAPILTAQGEFEFTGDSYVARFRSRTGDPSKPSEDDSEPATNVTVTMNLRGGVIRDYEVRIEGTRRATRARISVPVTEQRIVVLTYVPINRIDIPSEAREKLRAAKTPGAGRAKNSD